MHMTAMALEVAKNEFAEEEKERQEAKQRKEFADQLFEKIKPSLKFGGRYEITNYYAAAEYDFFFYPNEHKTWLQRRHKAPLVMQVIDCTKESKREQDFKIAVFSPDSEPIAKEVAGFLTLVHKAKKIKLFIVRKKIDA
jgi:hypothetical protein